MSHKRNLSTAVEIKKEQTVQPDLKHFAELSTWATRYHQSKMKRPQKKWIRLRDFTLYWCQGPQDMQAEGCIRFLYDEFSVEVQEGTKLNFKCEDKDRLFDLHNAADAQQWLDRCNKILKIRHCNGANFGEDGRTVFSNAANMFLLANNEWIAVGKGTLKLVVDTKQSGAVPDVASVMTVPSDTGSKSYEFLCAPYIKPKGNKTWILPKAMDMHTEFNQQTLAFRFPSENDAQVFQNIFDNSFRAAETEVKHDSDSRLQELEEENKKLKEEIAALTRKKERLKEKTDALKKLIERARKQGKLAVTGNDQTLLEDDDDNDEY